MLYKQLYYHLFNALTDAIELMEQNVMIRARDTLIRAQQETEEIYMEVMYEDNQSEDGEDD